MFVAAITPPDIVILTYEAVLTVPPGDWPKRTRPLLMNVPPVIVANDTTWVLLLVLANPASALPFAELT